MRIKWTEEASAELDHMLGYICEQDTSAAALVAERVQNVEKNIVSFPKAGRYDSETDTYDRYIPRTRIILTYTIRDDTIWIITAWHTSRDLETRPARP